MLLMFKPRLPQLLRLALFCLAWLGAVTALSAQSTEIPAFTNAVRYFSPNLDGKKDVLTIPVVIYDEGKLAVWRVIIYQKVDTRFRTIKTFSLASAVEGEALSFKRSFQRLFKRDEGVTPPGYVEWNGVSDDNALMADGIYYLGYYARDINGNEQTSDLYPIVIDTLSPQAELELNETIFSPNGDERKETLTAALTTEQLYPLDTLMVSVVAGGEGSEMTKVVRRYSALAPQAQTLSWDGLQDNGRPAAEGLYRFHVVVSDFAGNVSEHVSKSLRLVRQFEVLEFSASLPAISPNSDGFFDTLTFDSALSSERGLERWQLTITPAGSQEPVMEFAGLGRLKATLLYDGKDANGAILRDGKYTAQLVTSFDSGNIIHSQPLALAVDNTPPQLSATANERYFNPAALTGGSAQLSVTQRVSGTPKDTYRAAILGEAGELVYDFPETTGAVPERVRWDGKNNNAEIVPGLYQYRLRGTDALANSIEVTTDFFELISEQVNVRLRASAKVFSPNDDGIKDDVRFLLNISEVYRRLLTKGSIEIAMANKRRVKAIPFTTYTNRFLWRGADAKGMRLKDGKYIYRAVVKFSTGEELTTPYGQFYIDTLPPQLAVEVTTPLFSPNEDGRLDAFIAVNHLTPSTVLAEEDVFEVQLSTAGEPATVVREKSWTGALPPQIKWTGVNDLGNAAAEGLYHYQVTARDAAGNVSQTKALPFELVRTEATLTLALSAPLLSFHPEATAKQITLTPELSSTRHFTELRYQLNLPDKTQTLARQSHSSPYVWPQTAATAKAAHTIPPSGVYAVTAEANFASGAQVRSAPQSLTIDNTPPTVNLQHDPKYFSPDGDDEREILRLRVQAADNHEIRRTQLSIFRRIQLDAKGNVFPQTLAAYAAAAPPFKTFRWDGAVDEQLNWDGVGEHGELVESANDYLAFLETTDAVGLRTVTMDTVQVDIFVERLADGRLRIVINSINFKYDSARMVGDFTQILDRLALMLARFPEYQIEVLGHTDSRGSDPYNVKLSEDRARTVFNALSTRGVPAKIMTYRGAGESERLIAPELVEDASLSEDERIYLTEENYRKNRRVEFYLARTEKGEPN